MTTPSKRTSIHGNWSSRLAFILAATGAAVGLGNIWRFPYITGENGGGAFVLVYLACVIGVGLPVMIAEMVLGRRGRRNPINTMKLLSEEESSSSWWQSVGWLGVITGMLILSFYSVVAGWTLAYSGQAVSGAFVGATQESASRMFGELLGSPMALIGWHTVFMGMTVFVVARGVQHGLEAAVRYLMPLLLLLLLVLVGYSMTNGYFMQGFHFMFDPDFSVITPGVVVIALGQAFFTLSVGMGAIMAYGAYLPEDTPLAPTAAWVVGADTFVALLAGLAIFPIVFAFNLDPAGGPGLIFETLPIAFGQMKGGLVFGSIFFLLLVVAAWTSAIGLIEPAVAYCVESSSLTRRSASILIGGTIWVLGIVMALSFNMLDDVSIAGMNLFDATGYLTNNIALPLGGLLIAVFAGWVMSKGSTMDEFERGSSAGYAMWRFLIRFVAPLGLILVFLSVIGVIDFSGAADVAEVIEAGGE